MKTILRLAVFAAGMSILPHARCETAAPNAPASNAPASNAAPGPDAAGSNAAGSAVKAGMAGLLPFSFGESAARPVTIVLVNAAASQWKKTLSEAVKIPIRFAANVHPEQLAPLSVTASKIPFYPLLVQVAQTEGLAIGVDAGGFTLSQLPKQMHWNGAPTLPISAAPMAGFSMPALPYTFAMAAPPSGGGGAGGTNTIPEKANSGRGVGGTSNSQASGNTAASGNAWIGNDVHGSPAPNLTGSVAAGSASLMNQGLTASGGGVRSPMAVPPTPLQDPAVARAANPGSPGPGLTIPTAPGAAAIMAYQSAIAAQRAPTMQHGQASKEFRAPQGNSRAGELLNYLMRYARDARGSTPMPDQAFPDLTTSSGSLQYVAVITEAITQLGSRPGASVRIPGTAEASPAQEARLGALLNRAEAIHQRASQREAIQTEILVLQARIAQSDLRVQPSLKNLLSRRQQDLARLPR